MASLTRRCSKSTATSQRKWATALVTKVGPQPTVSASPGSLLKMPILRLPESETMGSRRGTAMCDRASAPPDSFFSSYSSIYTFINTYILMKGRCLLKDGISTMKFPHGFSLVLLCMSFKHWYLMKGRC